MGIDISHTEKQDAESTGVTSGFWLRLVLGIVVWVLFLFGVSLMDLTPHQYIIFVISGIVMSEIALTLSW
jgi:hypothetical protein